MKGFRNRIIALSILFFSVFLLVSCNMNTDQCYYGYFEDTAYAFIYTPKTNGLYCIKLPLEQILRWGKASGLDSIPMAMKNYVGLTDTGLMLGTSEALDTLKDILDALGSESDDPPSDTKRVRTMVGKSAVLSKKPLSDKINQLCGQDSQELSALLARTDPECWCYDADSFFDTDDLNFSQRYFTEWLNQVLGGKNR